MEKYLNIFQCLSDETRFRIFRLLIQKGELCVCEIEEALSVPQYVVSRSLRNLKERGLVQRRKEGPWRLYSVFLKRDRFFKALVKFLREAIPVKKEDIKRLKSKSNLRMRRLNICKSRLSR